MAGSPRPDWYSTFNSPILSRLAYWRAQKQQREEREEYLRNQQKLMDEMTAKLEQDNFKKFGPRLVGGDDGPR